MRGARADYSRMDEGVLFELVKSRDESAWREFISRYEEPIRDAIRAVDPDAFTEEVVGEVLSDFWLRLVDQDMRLLRSFAPEKRARLVSWLTIRASQVAYERLRAIQEEPGMVPLDQVPEIADMRRFPAPAPRMMRVEEVAERWDLNVKTVYGMIERGELVSRRCGRVIRVPRHIVESFEQASVAPERKKPCR